jgi:heme A synthase
VSRDRSFLIAARLAGATTFFMLGLMVLGSVVRTTCSGLACPEWPLCEGRIIPRFQFNVLIEWWHRAIALLVSLCLFATVGWTLARAETRRILGGLAVLATCLLFVQVLLGALTVWKLLSPSVVSSHLAVALLLFSTIVLMTRTAWLASAPPSRMPSVSPLLATGFVVVALLTFVQAVLGGAVSSSHAGLACPDWPACRGELFPPLEGPVGLQMMHRYTAYVLLAGLALLSFGARRAADDSLGRLATMALMVGVIQASLGVANVLLRTPVWLSAAHLGMATLLLGVLVLGAQRATTGVRATSSLRATGSA